jgi:DnaJ-class molecular chaperone
MWTWVGVDVDMDLDVDVDVVGCTGNQWFHMVSYTSQQKCPSCPRYGTVNQTDSGWCFLYMPSQQEVHACIGIGKNISRVWLRCVGCRACTTDTAPDYTTYYSI